MDSRSQLLDGSSRGRVAALALNREMGLHNAMPGRSRQLHSASPLSLVAKRSFDASFALLILLLLAPLLLIIAAALLVVDGRPIFYRQRRIGLDGREFGCLKFRSMVKDANERLRDVLESSEEARKEWAECQKLRNDPRVHVVGRILRKTSLDELPQFFNVLRGEMSVVGPRPIVRDEVSRYGEHIAHYEAVRPGVTGLWQVSGRNAVSYQERVALDVAYVTSLSPLNDAKIIVKTVGIVLTGSGDH